MWTLCVFVTLTLISWAGGQNRGPRQQQQGHQGNGPDWDIRLAVPGDPGNDYPTLGNIPRTSFTCSGKAPGYYADTETNCQAFRVCTSGSTYGFQSFLCPNGTLFNQAVVVCDWWMNVNCQKTQEYININNDKFGNLRLGPQLMKDVKKMITHPMRNPYDKTVMKSNLIVMQDYKPPIGQMFPGGSLIAGPARAPNSIYVPAKQIQQPYDQNVYSPNGNVFAASTPSPTYVPPYSSQRDAEVFQRQRQNGQYRQSARLQSTPQTAQFGNGHAGQYTQNQGFSNNANLVSRPAQLYSQPQRQTNYANTQTFNQRGQIRHNGQYTDGRSQQQSQQNVRQNGYEQSYQKQQYSNNAFTNDNSGQIFEAKQNLVSDETPATIISKTLTYNKIADPEPGKPKSRITIKTWIVKPTKAAKLIAEPTAYNYARPTNPPSQKQVVEGTPYQYNVPTTPQSARQESERPYTYNRPTVAAKQVEGPYAYNRPTTAAKQVEGPYAYNRPTAAAKQVEGPYVYNRPTVAAKQIVTTPSRLYLTPTSPPPTLSRLYLTPSTPPPTVASRLYLPPTTYKPAAKLYIPPSQTNLILSKQYLAPSALQQPAYYQSEQLQASPTSPTPAYAAPNENPSFSLTKHSRINANHNNLTFADILTKEKLDITVNDIVSDTSKVLKTASPQLEQYREDKSEDYSDGSYGSDINNESDEQLTPQSPTIAATSARLVEGPSRDLEPPVETYFNNQNIVNTNRLATLPFYKEPATNTIERTVSLKISIPEKVASYLFKNNESNYDKLEILNTGSSNYLVLTNNLLPKTPGANFIPIGRLIADKTSNISDSQALVFNFLADSLNQAKEYSNIATQNVATPTPSQFQGVSNQELARITNQISQLTASQYSNNQNINNYNHANIIPSSQTADRANQYQAAKYTNGYTQNQQQINSAPARLISQGYAHNSNSGYNGNLQLSQNQIYSGQLYQLPVPDVTNHIYNAGSGNLIQSGHQSFSTSSTSSVTNQNARNNLSKHSNAEVEIIQSQTLPIAPAKLQQFTPNEAETFNSQDHSAQALIGNFLNNGNGISAQLQDKIVGTIPHPLEDNKLVTYKKDQSYYVYTKLNNNVQKGQVSNVQTSNGQSANLVQNSNTLFSFLPSVSYQLEDEKEQQKILNAFQIDEYGSPKKNQVDDHLRREDLIAQVDYSVDHPQSAKQVEAVNEINTLYAGPSSYSAPQASVGSLETNEGIQNNYNRNARLEIEDNGYNKVTPARPFGF